MKLKASHSCYESALLNIKKGFCIGIVYEKGNAEEIVKRVNEYETLKDTITTSQKIIDSSFKDNKKLVETIDNLEDKLEQAQVCILELVEALKNTLKTINGVRSKSELLEDEIKRFGLDDYWELIEKAEG